MLVPEHRSVDERVEVGQSCMLKLGSEIPAVVDEMDDAVSNAYAGMPERLYLIGSDGNIAYKGGMGPMFFRPVEWEQAIREHLEAAASQ